MRRKTLLRCFTGVSGPRQCLLQDKNWNNADYRIRDLKSTHLSSVAWRVGASNQTEKGINIARTEYLWHFGRAVLLNNCRAGFYLVHQFSRRSFCLLLPQTIVVSHSSSCTERLYCTGDRVREVAHKQNKCNWLCGHPDTPSLKNKRTQVNSLLTVFDER